MGEYEDRLNAISREPVMLVVVTMDWCQNTFGQGGCTATGEPCYNTFPTCRDKANYAGGDDCQSTFGISPCTATGTPCDNTLSTCGDVPNFTPGTKDYRFTDREGAIPGARPYLVRASDLPTKIAKSLSVKGRLKISLADELDDDTGFDPYVTQRAAFPDIPGTWAKKWLARNHNFRGRRVRRYDGFMGIDESSYVQTWEGKIEAIDLSGTELVIEAVDLLGDLDKIKVPAKIDCKLVADISGTDTTATLSSVEDIPASGYLVFGKELVSYSAKNPATNEISGLLRGREGTTAEEHNRNEKVGLVHHYSGNPFEILETQMLETDANVDPSFIDSDAFGYWKDLPEVEPDFEAFIVKPTSLRDLYFELVEHCLAKSWVGEDLKITIRRDMPNEPGRSYRDLTGRANFADPKMPVDWQDRERRSRYALHWERTDHFADLEDEAAYLRRDIGVHTDTESANDMGGPDEETVYSRWVHTGTATEEELQNYVTNLVSRRVQQLKDPRPVITAMLDRKDQGIRTGEWVRVDTKAVLNPDGTPLEQAQFQVIERSVKGGGIQVKLRRTSNDPFLCIAPDSLMSGGEPLDWAGAARTDQEYGCISDDDGTNPGAGKIF